MKLYFKYKLTTIRGLIAEHRSVENVKNSRFSTVDIRKNAPSPNFKYWIFFLEIFRMGTSLSGGQYWSLKDEYKWI